VSAPEPGLGVPELLGTERVKCNDPEKVIPKPYPAEQRIPLPTPGKEPKVVQEADDIGDLT
jgi:hypothetical protein